MILLHRLRTHFFKQLAQVSIEFPERGTVLIEGLNEAGKSSLFEAVFFALELLAPPDFDPALLEAPFFAAAIEVPLTLCPLR